MFSAALSAIMLLFQTAPAAAPPSAPPDAGKAVSGVTVSGKTAQSEEAAASTIVCHNEPVIGSLFPKKVCATRRENADRRKADQEVARDYQRSLVSGAQPH